MFVSFPPDQPHARPWGNDRACVELGGGTAVVLADAAECDALIAAAVEAKRLLSPPEPETVPWPTGLCGHTVTPGAWSQSFVNCRDCLTPGDMTLRAAYDRATAGEQLPPAPERFISAAPFCTASCYTADGTVYCELPMGHGGDHRSPGTEEVGEDITWPAVPVSVSA